MVIFRREGYRQKATGQKATKRNVKMLLSCQDVLERLRVVLKTVEQIVLQLISKSSSELFNLCVARRDGQKSVPEFLRGICTRNIRFM